MQFKQIAAFLQLDWPETELDYLSTEAQMSAGPLQYAARLDAEKIKHHMHKLHGGKGINNFKMKLVDETLSGVLTGFERNAVSPVGSKTQLPIVVSDKISQLTPDFFWLGAGETDLKLGMSFAAFKAAYKPKIIDCTGS